MNVSIYGPNLGRDSESFHVHRTGCADTEKRFYKRLGPDQGGWHTDAESIQEIVEEVYCDIIAENEGQPPYDDWSSYLQEFHIFPCVTLPQTT